MKVTQKTYLLREGGTIIPHILFQNAHNLHSYARRMWYEVSSVSSVYDLYSNFNLPHCMKYYILDQMLYGHMDIY